MGEPDLYDEIASVYHLIHADWEASIERQAAQLDALLSEALGPGPHAILDVSCGIGTQALGLAGLGHAVTGSDLSEPAIARAREEAATRGLEIEFTVGDMRRCDEQHGREFDVVLSADNCVPHLLTEAEILAAFRAFRRCTRPGGVCLITVRDYEQEDRSTPQLRSYGIREHDDGRTLVMQSWDVEGDQYDIKMYFLRERHDGTVALTTGTGRYYAISTGRLLELLREAGFSEARRLDDRFFQPVLLARRSVD